MGIENTFGRLRIENATGDVFIADINKLIVPDTWLSITGPDEATLIVGDVDSLTSLTNITIDADTDANGSGTIALRTRNLNRLVINNDGTANLLQNDFLIGTFSGGNSGGRIRLATDSAAIYAALTEQTFDFTNGPVGETNYSNHTLALAYNSDFAGQKVVADEVHFGLSHEPKYCPDTISFQTEIYYAWGDPTDVIAIRPWGLTIQHDNGDTRFDMHGEVNYHRHLSEGGAQTAIWKEDGILEFQQSTGAVVFLNNALGLKWANAADTNTISAIHVDNLDQVVVGGGGGAPVIIDGPATIGSIAGLTTATGAGDADTGIEFPGSDIIYLRSGGNFPLTIEPGDVRLQTHFVFDADNTYDIGIVAATDKRPRDIKAGRDIYAGGSVFIAGTGLSLVEGGVINWDSSDLTLTQAGNVLTMAGGDLALANMTTGSVLFAGASGLVSQDNGGFFWDNTNNRLGINVTTPLGTLDVRPTAGGATAALLFNYNVNNHTYMRAGSETADFHLGDTLTQNILLVEAGGNVSIGGGAFGTSADGVLAIKNGTAPSTGPADTVQFYSSDDAAGHTIPSFFCEGTNVVATGQADSASSVRVKIRINGVVRTFLCI